MAKKAVFLDRDGVINVNHHYVGQIERFEFCPQALDAMAMLQQAGWHLVVITNQSGVARGMYQHGDVIRLTDWMVKQLRPRGISLSGFYYCPHGPDEGCACRKPLPGMIENACNELDLDPRQSVFIGDSDSDMQAAMAANVAYRLKIGDKSGEFDHLYAAVLHVLHNL